MFSDHVIDVTCLALQYPLYTIMAFDEWRNDILVAFFVISRTREQDLHPVLHALHQRVHSLKTDWSPSSIIVDNAQAEINTLRYSLCVVLLAYVTCHIYVFHTFYANHMGCICVLCGQHCMAICQDILMSMACLEVLGGERSEEDICGYREGHCPSDARIHNVR